ncbi:hypothetical protein PAXRUDRAFT_20496 [Paxillus rubicundulus Ve08.2h10]|uniref:Uncharacterized protein n=1 Tax=Paxillus rubicundulus Ve08.2h10 TaxID=930991 RepID=A0A0D0CSC6_9AGAM|nr:hypothetical protein PAXRUDRAFT_20496 [Paxillus rubicundulus Ve08.2h10]
MTKPEIVKKAFLLSKAGANNQFNLSFKCLSSPETLQALRTLPQDEPKLWKKLTGDMFGKGEDAAVPSQATHTASDVGEDGGNIEPPFSATDLENTELTNDNAPLDVVMEHLANGNSSEKLPVSYTITTDGSIVITMELELYERVVMEAATDETGLVGVRHGQGSKGRW